MKVNMDTEDTNFVGDLYEKVYRLFVLIVSKKYFYRAYVLDVNDGAFTCRRCYAC
jgi:hypothetical protein